jgi:hypothetical protein
MPKPIGVISILADVKGPLSCDAILTHTGRNTGNLLFSSAVYTHFEHTQRFPFNFTDRVQELNQDFAGIVIPAANWINPAADWGFLADRLEKLTIPIACVGLGAQITPSGIDQLTEGTIRFLKALSHKTAVIGTRGINSSEVLAQLGIHNTIPIGCPSVFPGLRLPDPVPFNYSPDGIRFSISQTRYDRDDELARNQQFLARMAARRAHSIVLQSETEELKAALERDKSNNAWIARYYGISLRGVDSLVAKFHVFSNAADWISFHKMNTDFTISSRIHGCIASLLAGKPAMLVQHDARTMELAETMGVSAIPIEKARKSDRLFFRDRLLSRDYLRAHYKDWAFRAKAEKNLAALLNLYRTNGLNVVSQ